MFWIYFLFYKFCYLLDRVDSWACSYKILDGNGNIVSPVNLGPIPMDDFNALLRSTNIKSSKGLGCKIKKISKKLCSMSWRARSCRKVQSFKSLALRKVLSPQDYGLLSTTTASALLNLLKCKSVTFCVVLINLLVEDIV